MPALSVPNLTKLLDDLGMITKDLDALLARLPQTYTLADVLDDINGHVRIPESAINSVITNVMLGGIVTRTIDGVRIIKENIKVGVINYLLRNHRECYLDELVDNLRHLHGRPETVGYGLRTAVINALETLTESGILCWINEKTTRFNRVRSFTFRTGLHERLQVTMQDDIVPHGPFDIVSGSQTYRSTAAPKRKRGWDDGGHSQEATCFRIRESHRKPLEDALRNFERYLPSK